MLLPMIQRTYPLTGRTTFAIPENAVCRTYETTLLYNDGLKISFETDIAFLGDDNCGNIFCYSNKKEIYINGNAEPELMVYNLIIDSGKALYPALFVISTHGSVQDVLNLKDIAGRWLDIKAKIQQYYQGKVADHVVQQMDYRLNHSETLTEALKDDWLWAILFPGFYRENNEGVQLKTNFSLPIIPYASPSVNYTAIGKPETSQPKDSTFTVLYDGQVDDNRCIEHILNGNTDPLPPFAEFNNRASGNMQLEYAIYKSDYSIQFVKGKASFKMPDSKEKNVIIEIQHLPDRDRLLKEAVLINNQ